MADLTSIANEGPTILSAEMHEATCRVFTDLGVLEIECNGGSIALDSGRAISLDELLAASKAYWDEWESKSKRES